MSDLEKGKKDKKKETPRLKTSKWEGKTRIREYEEETRNRDRREEKGPESEGKEAEKWQREALGESVAR